MYLGVDIGGTAVKLGLVSKDGDQIKTDIYDVSFDGYETPILETVKKSIDKFLKLNDATKKIKGIGVSATGQIDSKKGKVVGVGGNIKNWCGAEIKKELEEIYNVNTTVVNDANCMVIGEQWKGAAKGYNDVIGITIGTGVGGGIIVNSNILLGSVGIAGEIGHFSINSEGKKCTCGNIGCYEQYASMTALIKRVQEKYETLKNINFSKEQVNGEIIFNEVKNNNYEIKKIVDEWIVHIGKGLVSLTHIFNPDIILIGGGVSKQEDLFIKPLKEYVKNNVMDKFKENLEIKSAELGNNAGLIGAVYYNIINN